MSCEIATNKSDAEINKKNGDSRVLELIHQKAELKKKISDAENMMRESKKKIKDIDRALFRECNHIWQYDFNCAFDDHTKHFCITCGVWKNQYWYT